MHDWANLCHKLVYFVRTYGDFVYHYSLRKVNEMRRYVTADFEPQLHEDRANKGGDGALSIGSRNVYCWKVVMRVPETGEQVCDVVQPELDAESLKR